MEATTSTAYLVVRADGEMRIVRGKRGISLRLDEIAFPLRVTIPNQWGKVQTMMIELTMPEPPEAIVDVGEPETSAE